MAEQVLDLLERNPGAVHVSCGLAFEVVEPKVLETAFCAATLVTYCASVGAFEPPDGFRGIKWRDDISSVKGQMTVVEEDKTSKYYTRKGDKLSIGGAALKTVGYGFYKGRFYFVMIEFESLSDYVALKGALEETYGRPMRPNQFMEKYFWGTTSDVLISLDYSEITKKGTLTYGFKPILAELKADAKEDAKAAKKDF